MGKLKVDEYLNLFARIQAPPGQTDQALAITLNRMVEFLGLTDVRYMLANEITYLEQIKLSIAFDLLGRANVLLFNNPSARLTVDDRRELWRILLRLKTHRAIFVATNSVDEADYIADEVFVFFNETVHFQGSTDSLKKLMESQFLLQVSRQSMISKSQIENLIEKCKLQATFMENQSSLTEMVFSFKCQKEGDQIAISKFLDRLSSYSKKGNIVINSVSMNSLSQVLAGKLQINTSEVKPLKMSIETNIPTRFNFFNNCKLTRALTWQSYHLLRYRFGSLLVLICFGVFFDIIPSKCAQSLSCGYANISTSSMLKTIRQSLVSHHPELEPLVHSYCKQFNNSRCQVLSTEINADRKWIYQNAEDIHEYIHEYVYSYEIFKDVGNIYSIKVNFNPYSRFPFHVGAIHFLSHFIKTVLCFRFNLIYYFKYISFF